MQSRHLAIFEEATLNDDLVAKVLKQTPFPLNEQLRISAVITTCDQLRALILERLGDDIDIVFEDLKRTSWANAICASYEQTSGRLREEMVALVTQTNSARNTPPATG